MSNPGTSAVSHAEIIEKLKHEIKINVAPLKSSLAWVQFEKLYQALGVIEQVSGTRKTSLEDVLGPVGTSLEPPPSLTPTGKESELALGDQQEAETIAEIEKGS